MKLIQKAYALNTSRFEEPYFAPDNVVYATSRGKAKTMLWDQIMSDGYTNDIGEEITFLNLPIRRAPNADKYEYFGKIMTKSDIDYQIRKRDRDLEFEDILIKNPNSFAYIQKGGRYYRPNCNGYTDYKWLAGVYTLEKAVSECKGCSLGDNMRPTLINIDEHNKMLEGYIKDFKEKML